MPVNALTFLVRYAIIDEKETEVTRCVTLIILDLLTKNGIMKLSIIHEYKGKQASYIKSQAPELNKLVEIL